MLTTIVRIAQVGFFVAITALVVWFLWGKLDTEPRRELDPYRRTLSERVVEEAVFQKLPRRDEIKKLAVMPVRGDLDGRVFDMLYDALEDAELYFLVDDDTVASSIEEEAEGEAPLTWQEAVKVGRRLKAKDDMIEGVLFSALGTFSDGRRGLGAEVTLNLTLAELKNGGIVPEGVVSATAKIDSKASLDYFACSMESVSVVLRGFLVVLFTAGLPFALYPVVRAVVRRRKTQHNVALVAVLTIVDGLVTLLLQGLRPGWLGALVLLVVVLGAAIYNIAVAEKIEAVG